MAFQYCPDIVRVSLLHTSMGQQVVNTYHCKRLGSIDPAALEELCDYFDDWDAEFASARRHSGATLDRIVALDLSSPISGSFELAVTPPRPGASAAEQMPNNVAAVTTLITPNRGRSYRGRVYWGMLTETIVHGDTIEEAQAANFSNSIEALTMGLVVLNWQLVVLTRYQAGELRPIGEGTIVTGWRTSTQVKSQRRRLP